MITFQEWRNKKNINEDAVTNPTQAMAGIATAVGLPANSNVNQIVMALKRIGPLMAAFQPQQPTQPQATPMAANYTGS